MGQFSSLECAGDNREIAVAEPLIDDLLPFVGQRVKGAEAVVTGGIGFQVSDEVRGVAAFIRCSTDHHNLLIQPSPGRVPASHVLASR